MTTNERMQNAMAIFKAQREANKLKRMEEDKKVADFKAIKSVTGIDGKRWLY